MKYEFDNTGYGPILEIVQDELAPYIKFSEKAFRYYIENISSVPQVLLNKDNYIFNLLLSNAKNNSFSIRLLSTWAQPIEAYALLRIRLEQLIISSYLIHADHEKGIIPFKKYHSEIENNILKTYDNSELLKKALSIMLPEYKKEFDAKLEKTRKQNNHSNEGRNATFKKKWTNLNIKQLAEQRDKLIDEHDVISNFKLSVYYDTLYKISSSIIHSDIASIAPDFISPNEQGIISPQVMYVFTNIITLVHFDIIQCYETAKSLSLNIEKKFIELYKNYQDKIKKDFEIKI